MTVQTDSQGFWRKCTTCKKPIAFAQKYWICSVSTCNRIRTGLVFCSVECFDAHVPVLNHRDAGAYEKRAPTEAQWRAEQETAKLDSPKQETPKLEHRPSQGLPQPGAATGSMASQAAPAQDEILVVVSKVKEYIRARSGMSTSDRVMDLLSRRIRVWANDAIRRAEQDGRKTVMDRDIR